MYKTCARCGTIHDINIVCYRNKVFKKENTDADKFRKTYKWQQRAEEIKKRDKYLCRVCIAKIYNTTIKYNYNKLEVHHIIPLEEDYNKRLDEDNLITLCCYHHKLAEKGIINREILGKLTNKDCNLEEIRVEVGLKNPPLPC